MPKSTKRRVLGDSDPHPANRLGLDYRDVPVRKLRCPIVDAHTHVRSIEDADLFFEVAALYGIWQVASMTPIAEVPALREKYGERISFIAIPNWHERETIADFQAHWLENLVKFRQYGAALCKFWMAPPMRGDYGLTLDHEFFQPIIERALELGYGFMTHISDPSIWFEPGGRYEDTAKYGTNAQQFDQLHYLLEKVSPHPVVGAHMGGNVEDVPFLQNMLDQYPNYYLDSSATKWIVREVSRQPVTVRDFLIRNQDRVLFGSDLVTATHFDFDHYASRYWAHLHLWETNYRGESPIIDPDVVDRPPTLDGLDLPTEVLEKMYYKNAERVGMVGHARLAGGG